MNDYFTLNQILKTASPQFFADRQRLMSKLDDHLLNSTRLRGQASLGDHPKLKTALGISSKSLVHHWSKAGAPGQIPGYATHVDANYIKTGGMSSPIKALHREPAGHRLDEDQLA